MTGFLKAHQNSQAQKSERARKPEQAHKPASPGQMMEAPESLRIDDVLSAQQSLGNQVVQRALDSNHKDAGVADQQGNLHPSLSETIQKARGSGSPLPGDLEKEMGKKLRHNFSGVRLHTDETADRVSRAIHARAFTIGRDIFFKKNVFAPATQSGRETLVHELTHVVQQSASHASGLGKLKLGERGSAMEKQAERLSKHDQNSTSASSVTAAGAAPVVSRSAVPDEEEIQTQGEEEEIQTQGEEEEIQTQGDEEEIQTQGDEEEIQTQGDEEEIQTQPDTVQRWPDDLMPSKGRVSKLARQHLNFIANAKGQSPLGQHRLRPGTGSGVSKNSGSVPTPEQRATQVKKPIPITPPQKEAQIKKPLPLTPSQKADQVKKPLPLTPSQKADQVKKPLPLTPPQKAAQIKKPLPLTPPQKEAQKKKPLPPLPSGDTKPEATQPSVSAPLAQNKPETKWQKFKGFMSNTVKPMAKKAVTTIGKKVGGFAVGKLKENATEGLKQFGLGSALGLDKKDEKEGESGSTGKGTGDGSGMGGAMLTQLMTLVRENEQLKARVAKLEEGKGS